MKPALTLCLLVAVSLALSACRTHHYGHHENEELMTYDELMSGDHDDVYHGKDPWDRNNHSN